jgi:protein-S-isoprenylcysteine O-methyltransferase Ste14
MNWQLIKAIILLPGTVLVFVPVAVLLASRQTPFPPDFQPPFSVTFLMAVGVMAAGAYLAVRTATLFTRAGEGTPAPWAPPKKLVILGPYRYVRNPMIGGVILVLVGESILFNSWPLLLWALIFWGGNLVYLPMVEEKGLIERFGKPYVDYAAQVPRWLPGLVCWNG